MKKRMTWPTRVATVLLLLILLAPLALLTPAAHAQDYAFSVPELEMQVFIQPDASARIEYDITFRNSETGRPIDIVDIGLPHDDYRISTMRASLDTMPLTIRPSEFVSPGVEMPLGANPISSGEQGVLHFEFTMPDMVYADTTRDDYASFQITPTWFDADFVTGDTNLRIAVHMLPGIEPDEVLFQDVPFTNKALFNDRAVVVWEESDWTATEPYRVGVSFPQRGMTRVIEQTIIDLAVKFLEDNPTVHLIIVGIFVSGLAFLFFRFSGGTGCSIFLPLAAVLGFCAVAEPVYTLIYLVPLPFLIFINEIFLQRRRSRQGYLPAIAQVEGGGIKRGLTAAEAAVILEQPLSKVLTLVIFGLLKKGVLRQVEEKPLKVEVVADFRVEDTEGRAAREKQRLKAAQQHGIVLHKYEHLFLDLIEQQPGKPLNSLDFSPPMRGLIEHAAARMKNFDLSDTQDYYRSIIKRALDEARSLGDVGMRQQALDRNLEWVLMNDDYGDVFTSRSRGYAYHPVWIRSTPSSGAGIGAAAGTGGPAYGGGTTLGDVGASFAGWAENTMGSMADAIAPGSLQVATPTGGFIDLSGVDRVTGDVFEALGDATSSGGGGGSGGGGCACACAGCACACACAGGGR